MAQPDRQPINAAGRWRRIAPAMLLVALALCYLPALTTTYGYADDFPQLLASLDHSPWLLEAWIEDARPVGGWLTIWSYRAAGTIAGLAYLRAAALLLTLLLALAIYRHLLALLGEPLPAALAAVFVCTVTPFQVNVGWAAMWLYMIPPVLSYGVYHLILRAESGGWRALARGLLSALILLYISLNIYPPSTMFLWFWFGVDVALADIPVSRLLRRFVMLLAACGAASALYYGVYKLLGYHHARGQITPDILKKLVWFVRAVVSTASRLQWFDTKGRWLPLLVWLVIAAGLLVSRRKSPPSAVARAALTIAVVFLSYLPLLSVKELYAPYRSQLVLAGYMAALAFLAVWQIMARVKVRASVASLVLCALAGAGLVKGNGTLMSHIVAPQSFDYLYLRGALADAWAAHQQAVVIEGTLPPACGDELCRVTSEMPDDYHMLSGMAEMVARESGHGADPADLRVVPYGTQVTPAADTAVIHMEAVKESLP